MGICFFVFECRQDGREERKKETKLIYLAMESGVRERKEQEREQ